MTQHHLKLRRAKAEEFGCIRWLVRLAAGWHFAIRGHAGPKRPPIGPLTCPSGEQHVFDLNAARNTVLAGAGMVVEEDYAAA